jgi:hypothetical protein
MTRELFVILAIIVVAGVIAVSALVTGRRRLGRSSRPHTHPTTAKPRRAPVNVLRVPPPHAPTSTGTIPTPVPPPHHVPSPVKVPLPSPFPPPLVIRPATHVPAPIVVPAVPLAAPLHITGKPTVHVTAVAKPPTPDPAPATAPTTANQDATGTARVVDVATGPRFCSLCGTTDGVPGCPGPH